MSTVPVVTFMAMTKGLTGGNHNTKWRIRHMATHEEHVYRMNARLQSCILNGVQHWRDLGDFRDDFALVPCRIENDTGDVAAAGICTMDIIHDAVNASCQCWHTFRGNRESRDDCQHHSVLFHSLAINLDFARISRGLVHDDREWRPRHVFVGIANSDRVTSFDLWHIRAPEAIVLIRQILDFRLEKDLCYGLTDGRRESSSRLIIESARSHDIFVTILSSAVSQ